MRVFQHIGVGARPLCRLGKVVPIGLGHQGRRDVHLLQLRAGAEIGANLVDQVALRIGAEMLGRDRIEDAMQHE